LSLSIEEAGSSTGVRIRVGLMILNDVVPRILEEGRWIGERVALAETWYMYLCSATGCPDVDSNPDNWGTKELKNIARALVSYAKTLLEPALNTPPPPELRRRAVRH